MTKRIKLIQIMLKTSLTIMLILLINSLCSAQEADLLIGKYQLPDKLDVEIFKVDGKYCGKIIALRDFEDGQTTDINNPDEAKHQNPLIGMQIINGLEYDHQEKKWINGEMYGPEKGMFFNLKVIEANANEIIVVGSKFIFWRTLVWKRI